MKTKKIKCAICGKGGKNKVLPSGVCIKCGFEIYGDMDVVINNLDRDVCNSCNIMENIKGQTRPIEICKCNTNHIIAYDYFAIPVAKGYRIILNGVCRGCTGYKELPTNIIHPINIKPSSNDCGYFLNSVNQGVDYIS